MASVSRFDLDMYTCHKYIMRKIEFAVGETYHVFNRGVDKRDIFLDDRDYYRFVKSLYEFNDEQPAFNTYNQLKNWNMNTGQGSIPLYKIDRQPLVDIFVFTLMSNHYHLMIRQIKPDGIVRFMQKLGTGYTMYFNKRYERAGSLFQGKFKAVHINTEAQFLYLPHYIHTNPLASYRGRTSIEKLLEYRWSSFSAYAGKRGFDRVSSRRALLDMYGGVDGYLRFTSERLESGDVLGDEVKRVIIE